MAKKMGTNIEITHHCQECGCQVVEFCSAHPGAMVESIATTAAAKIVRAVEPDCSKCGRPMGSDDTNDGNICIPCEED